MDLKLITVCLILLGSCQVVSPEEKAIIFFPEESSDQEKNMITKVGEKEKLEHRDYIQLALIYAKYDAETKIIGYLLDESLKLNKEKACEHLNGVLILRNEWSLAKKYGDLIRSRLSKYECNLSDQNTNL